MKKLSKQKEALAAYMFLLPEFLLMATFVFLPMIYAFYLSFTKWNGFNPVKEFVGFSNYTAMLSDSGFWNSLRITFTYTIAYVILLFVISLALALLNHAVIEKANQFYRTIIFAPHAVSLVIAGIIWSFMFNNQKGFINQVLQMLGLERQPFLASRSQALFSVIIMSLWIAAGYYMIIFVAALKDIPASQYEAASIDGANTLHKFFYITIPGVKDTSVFVFIVSTIAALQLFEPIQVVTKGGPAKSTYVIVKYIYDTAFQLQNMGGASAAAFILFLIILVLTVIQLNLPKSEA